MFLLPSEPTEAKNSLDVGFRRHDSRCTIRKVFRGRSEDLKATWDEEKRWTTSGRRWRMFGHLFDCINSFLLPTNISDVFGQKVNHRYYLQTVKEHLRIQTQNKIHLGLNNDCK